MIVLFIRCHYSLLFHFSSWFLRMGCPFLILVVLSRPIRLRAHQELRSHAAAAWCSMGVYIYMYVIMCIYIITHKYTYIFIYIYIYSSVYTMIYIYIYIKIMRSDVIWVIPHNYPLKECATKKSGFSAAVYVFKGGDKFDHSNRWCLGSFHSHGATPHSWMVFVRENPTIEWMMTRGTPMDWKPSCFLQSCRVSKDAIFLWALYLCTWRDYI